MSEKEKIITNEEELSQVSGGMIPPIPIADAFGEKSSPDRAVLPLLSSVEPNEEARSRFIPIL